MMMNHSGNDHSSVLQWQPNLIEIPDLVNLVADFCDDDSLSKLSRVNFVKHNIFYRQIKGSER